MLILNKLVNQKESFPRLKKKKQKIGWAGARFHFFFKSNYMVGDSSSIFYIIQAALHNIVKPTHTLAKNTYFLRNNCINL